ncbi:hypothetical protein [Streptomyces sp. FXY-T5]|uniref:hypothetical protein n=1 Tax=Streptomyces sp. FXY-T5 TaxID=3064901 RepID=UPI0027D224D9|nr:hypothetical protein [Streptomyces sp. FXY-T5]WMD04849.1 hypothetical protein Q7C01_10755 [Streptomyces sp. FXY-T5]
MVRLDEQAAQRRLVGLAQQEFPHPVHGLGELPAGDVEADLRQGDLPSSPRAERLVQRLIQHPPGLVVPVEGAEDHGQCAGGAGGPGEPDGCG